MLISSLKRRLDRALDVPRAWRERLRFYGYGGDKGDLGFCLMLAVPLVTIGVLMRLAHDATLARQAAQRRQAELRCLAENVYHEARGEPLAGQYAVAEVTLNRVASPLFPDTVCEVVHEQRLDPLRRRLVGAFSWTEFESLREPRGRSWQRARDVATTVYDGRESPLVPGALYYHAERIEPRWAAEKRWIASIGEHVFYE